MEEGKQNIIEKGTTKNITDFLSGTLQAVRQGITFGKYRVNMQFRDQYSLKICFKNV